MKYEINYHIVSATAYESVFNLGILVSNPALIWTQVFILVWGKKTFFESSHAGFDMVIYSISLLYLQYLKNLPTSQEAVALQNSCLNKTE